MKSPVLLVFFLVIAATIGLTIGRYGETVYNYFDRGDATVEVKSTTQPTTQPTQPKINKFISYNDLPSGARRIRSIGNDWSTFELRVDGRDWLCMFHRNGDRECITVIGPAR